MIRCCADCGAGLIRYMGTSEQLALNRYPVSICRALFLVIFPALLAVRIIISDNPICGYFTVFLPALYFLNARQVTMPSI